jgi:hypothetical protein
MIVIKSDDAADRRMVDRQARCRHEIVDRGRDTGGFGRRENPRQVVAQGGL